MVKKIKKNYDSSLDTYTNELIGEEVTLKITAEQFFNEYS